MIYIEATRTTLLYIHKICAVCLLFHLIRNYCNAIDGSILIGILCHSLTAWLMIDWAAHRWLISLYISLSF